jgi:hypothetical protein
MRRVIVLSAAATAAALGLFVAAAPGNTSHDGWPKVDGALLMNKTDSRRPLDGRPGREAFGGRDRRYSCDAIHKRGRCHRRFIRVRGRHGRVMTFRHGHKIRSCARISHKTLGAEAAVRRSAARSPPRASRRGS